MESLKGEDDEEEESAEKRGWQMRMFKKVIRYLIKSKNQNNETNLLV